MLSFFSKILQHVGTFLYTDDSTEKRKSLDVARFLIRTSSPECINQTIKVRINKVVFSIKIAEDWSGPLQWKQSDTKGSTSDAPSEEDSWQEEEEWRDNFDFNSDGDRGPVEEGGGPVVADYIADEGTINAINGINFQAVKEGIDDRINSNNEERILGDGEDKLSHLLVLLIFTASIFQIINQHLILLMTLSAQMGMLSPKW